MDLRDPTRAVSATLDGTVLAALASSGRPMTVSEIAQQATRGSEVGIRRSVDRLVVQGTVIATQMGRNRVHELNRDHVAAPAAALLADLRIELWRRLRSTFAEWDPAPLYACAFGSAARGDGDEDSDIDVLVVRPVFASADPGERLTGRISEMTARSQGRLIPARRRADWDAQVDALEAQVPRWTGNALHLVELDPRRWWTSGDGDDALREEIARDAIDLHGQPLPLLPGRVP